MDKPTVYLDTNIISAYWQEKTMNDDIVEQIRRIREELINRFGGIEGYFKHCQTQERTRTTRSKPRRRKQPAQTPRKSSKAR